MTKLGLHDQLVLPVTCNIKNVVGRHFCILRLHCKRGDEREMAFMFWMNDLTMSVGLFLP